MSNDSTPKSSPPAAPVDPRVESLRSSIVVKQVVVSRSFVTSRGEHRVEFHSERRGDDVSPSPSYSLGEAMVVAHILHKEADKACLRHALAASSITPEVCSGAMAASTRNHDNIIVHAMNQAEPKK